MAVAAISPCLVHSEGESEERAFFTYEGVLHLAGVRYRFLHCHFFLVAAGITSCPTSSPSSRWNGKHGWPPGDVVKTQCSEASLCPRKITAERADVWAFVMQKVVIDTIGDVLGSPGMNVYAHCRRRDHSMKVDMASLVRKFIPGFSLVGSKSGCAATAVGHGMPKFV